MKPRNIKRSSPRKLRNRPAAPPKQALAARTERALGTVPFGNQACLWMRAGVIKYRLCEQDFDCEHCMLDAALGGREAQATWSREWGASGSRLFPQDRQFSSAHAWAQETSSGRVRVGVDALAAWLVSEVTGVRVPEVGTEIVRGRPIGVLVAQGGELTISAPFDGRVTMRNELLLGCPELVTAAPYGAGWLVEIELDARTQPQRRAELLSGADAEALSRGQLHEFHRRVDALLASRAPQIGPTMADGGQPLHDPRAILGPALYLKLVQELLA